MDFKNYGVCGKKSGSVDWKITSSHLQKNVEDKNDHHNVHKNRNDENNNNLCFKYFDGITGEVRATSPLLFVYSDAQILIKSIECSELSPSHNCSYYAKISCSGTHNCTYRTVNSINACWKGLNFLFAADRSRELRFLIKEQRWSGNQILGLVNIPIIDLVQRRNQNLAFVLRKPNTDVNNSKYHKICVSCQLIPKQKQSYAETISSLVSNSSAQERLHKNAQLQCQPIDIKYKCMSKTSGSLTSKNSSSSTSSFSIFASSSLSPVPDVMEHLESQYDKIPSASNSINSMQTLFSLHNSILKLPQGWEVRVDRYGRLIYLDHINKRTSWKAPTILEKEYVPINDNKRYVFARRTVLTSLDNNKKTHSNVELQDNNEICSTRNRNDPNNKNHKIRAVHDNIQRAKEVNFIQRYDFFDALQMNMAALNLYNESAYLKHIISRIRKDPSKFALFKNNKELVQFLNLFADKTQPLPEGWQTAKNCDGDGQRLFIDHKTKHITLIDPRLPDELTSKYRAQSAPPTRRNINYVSNNIWDMLNRTDELQTLITKRFPEKAPKLCRKLQLIREFGEVALLRFANDVDLITAISSLENTPNHPSTEFEEKLEYFYSSLQKAGYGQGPGKIHFRLRRNHLMNDAFDKILTADSYQLRKCQMTVTFDEEDGLDYGGPSRELFFLLSRELFNPYYGLFEYSANDTYTVQISPISKFVDNYLQWMELCGRVFALALIHHCMIDTFFTRAFYKLILGIPYAISDLQAMDNQFHNSLIWIRDNEITNDLDLTFSTTEEVGGQIIEKELLPDGKNILVTDANKEDYISLMLRWRIERNVGPQGQALLRGIYSIIDKDYLRIFNGEQLELVLSGTVEINIEDWRENTEYKGGYYENHIVINWFWQTVYTLCNADRLKLLQFVTGTSSVPYEGFKALRGSNGAKKFAIEKWGTEESLPRAHTCFNRLDLPSYPTKKILCEKLKLAIYESACYTIE